MSRFFAVLAGLVGLFGAWLSLATLLSQESMTLDARTLAASQAIVLMALCVCTFLATRKAAIHHPFSPLVFYLVLYALFYALPALFACKSRNRLYYQITRLDQNLPEIMAIAFLGCTMFLVGYFILGGSVGRHSRIMAIHASESAVRRLWFLAFMAAWLGRAALMVKGIYLQSGASQGASSAYISFFGGLVFLEYLALPLSFDQHLSSKSSTESRNSSFWKRAFWLNVVMEYAYAIPTGSKGGVLIPILLLVGVWLLRGGKIRTWRLATAGVLLGSTYFLIAPISLTYREVTRDRELGWSQSTSLGALSGAAAETAGQVASRGTELYGEESQARIVARISYPAMLNDILVYLEGGGQPLKGRTYYLALVSPIPRVLWRGKPEMALGRYFSGIFGGDRYTSYAISQLGELYINFLLPGVICGMFVFGLLYRWLWNLFLPCLGGEQGATRALYLLLWVSFLVMGTGDNFATTLGGFIKILVMVSFLMAVSGIFPPWLRFRPRDQQTEPEPLRSMSGSG